MSTFSMSTIWFTFGKCTNLELLSIPTLDICTSWKHQIFYSLWPRECGLIGSCEWWLGFIASLVLSANHCLPHPALIFHLTLVATSIPLQDYPPLKAITCLSSSGPIPSLHCLPRYSHLYPRLQLPPLLRWLKFNSPPGISYLSV